MRCRRSLYTQLAGWSGWSPSTRPRTKSFRSCHWLRPSRPRKRVAAVALYILGVVHFSVGDVGRAHGGFDGRGVGPRTEDSGEAFSSPVCLARRMAGAFLDGRDDAAAGSIDVMVKSTERMRRLMSSEGQAMIEMPPAVPARLVRRQKAARCPRHLCEGNKGGCVDV